MSAIVVCGERSGKCSEKTCGGQMSCIRAGNGRGNVGVAGLAGFSTEGNDRHHDTAGGRRSASRV